MRLKKDTRKMLGSISIIAGVYLLRYYEPTYHFIAAATGLDTTVAALIAFFGLLMAPMVLMLIVIEVFERLTRR